MYMPLPKRIGLQTNLALPVSSLLSVVIKVTIVFLLVLWLLKPFFERCWCHLLVGRVVLDKTWTCFAIFAPCTPAPNKVIGSRILH